MRYSLKAMKLSYAKNKILAIIVLLAFVISLNFFQKNLQSFFYFFSSPIQKSLWKSGKNIFSFFSALSKIENLEKENEGLRAKINKILGENIQLKELGKENETLRKTLDFPPQKDSKLASAEVIAKDPLKDSILINKGRRDGISKGMPVLTEDKIVLGRVSEANSNFSRVLLISDKSSSFDAKIQGLDVSGIVKGEGNLQASFDLIPQDKEVKEGDIVVTSSLGGIFPKGFLVGEVKQLEKSDIKPYQKSALSPFFKLQNVETVFVITNFNSLANSR